MPKYGNTSIARLDSCHRDIITIFSIVIEKYDNTIICGHRTQEEQDKAFNEGYSKVQWPNGKHNSLPSMAVDAAPYFIDIKGIDWNDIPAICYFAGKVKAIADELYDLELIDHKLRWGGDWDGDNRNADQKFNDYVHFELVK